MKSNRVVLALAAPALAMVIALVVSFLVLLVSKSHPGEVWTLVHTEGFSLRTFVLTLNRAAPYYLSGVAVAIGFKMNLFNIGVEGQYRLAALVAAAAGAAVRLPAPIHVLFILVVAMSVGAMWASVAAVLKVTRGVSEVISTIMLNAIALGLSAFLLTRWFAGGKTGSTDYSIGTRPLHPSGHLPTLDRIFTAIGLDVPQGTRVEAFVLVAALVGVGYWLLVWRTRLGYDLRASGLNPDAARASGVSANRMVLIAMGLSGAVAGLVGLSTMLSQEPYRYSDTSVIGGFGFTGIAVALLGRNNPIGIAVGALLWAFMDILRTPLAQAELPNQIVSILQGTVVLSVVIAYELVRRIAERREAADLARAVHGPESAPPSDDAAEPAGAPA